MPADPARLYTAAELLDDAATQGTPVSARLITDWVAKGLLDAPRRRGLGRGRGTTATWPEPQRQLFLALLERRQHAPAIRALCNIPVAQWLYFGAEYVPIRQVRRALTTWGSAPRATPARAARHAARIAARGLDTPNMSQAGRAALLDAIVQANGAETLDRDALCQAVQRVFDLSDTSSKIGPPGAGLTPEGWVRTIEARLTALDSLDSLNDRDLEIARITQRVVIELIARQPHLQPASDDYLADHACLDLLSTLGVFKLPREPDSPSQAESAPPHEPRSNRGAPK